MKKRPGKGSLVVCEGCHESFPWGLMDKRRRGKVDNAQYEVRLEDGTLLHFCSLVCLNDICETEDGESWYEDDAAAAKAAEN